MFYRMKKEIVNEEIEPLTHTGFTFTFAVLFLRLTACYMCFSKLISCLYNVKTILLALLIPNFPRISSTPCNIKSCILLDSSLSM